MSLKQLTVNTLGLTLIFSLSNNVLANDRVDFADVVSVTPITRMVHIPSQHQECWNEVVTSPTPQSDSYTPTILGGVVGGVVGNQFGHGKGKTAATIAGALLGGSLGRDVGSQPSGSVVTNEQTRCRTIDDGVTEERVEAYNVTYQYDGVTYTTKMSYNPGTQIKVRVHTTVTPLAGR